MNKIFITIKFARFTSYSLSLSKDSYSSVAVLGMSKLDSTLGGEARLYYDIFREFVAKKSEKPSLYL